MRSGTAGTAPSVLVARPVDVLDALDGRELTPHEQRRGRALRHAADRDAYRAAHLLVRECAARLTGSPAGSVELAARCPECGSSEHGKPFLPGHPDVHVSLAHRRGAVIAGAGWAPLGVDVEPATGSVPDPAVLGYALTAAEADVVRAADEPSRAFLRAWVRKESLVKVGVATLDTLRRIDLTRTADDTVLDGRNHARHGRLHLVDWFDPLLGAMFAVAAAEPPVIATFGPVRSAPPA